MQRHCHPYSLFGHQHSFQDMYYDGAHSSTLSSSPSPSSPSLSSAFTGVFYHPSIRTIENGVSTLLGYLYNLHFHLPLLARIGGWLFTFLLFLQINRDDNIMQAWRFVCLLEQSIIVIFIRGVVSYSLTGWMDGWIALVTLP